MLNSDRGLEKGNVNGFHINFREIQMDETVVYRDSAYYCDGKVHHI